MARIYSESTGLINYISVTGSRKAALDSGFLKLYAGTVPADADAALGSATLLATLTLGGDDTTGLTFDATATDGTISKPSAATWQDPSPAASGTATFYRWEKTGDTGAATTTEIRNQGSVGTTGADLNVNSTSISTGTPFELNSYTIRQPPSYGG
jgi:hypothetical protein